MEPVRSHHPFGDAVSTEAMTRSFKIGPVRLDYILFFALFTLVSLFLLRDRHVREQEYFRLWEKQARIELDAALAHKRKFAEILLENRVLSPEVAALVAAAADAPDPGARTRIRDELRTLLAPEYRFLRSLRFPMLHFHLPGRISLLRFHAPEKFGDPLTTRKNLDETFREGRPTEGFETGPLFSGYTFVFPVRDGERIAGTVELGLALGDLQDEIDRISDSRHRFLLGGAFVRSMIAQRDEFAEWDIGSDFFAARASPASPDRTPDPETIREINRRIRQRAEAMLFENETFGVHTRLESGTFLVAFLAIRGDENLAPLFLSAYRRDTTLSGFRRSMLFTLSLTLFLLVVVTILHLWSRRRILKAEADIDSRERELAREIGMRQTAEASLENLESRLDALGRASMDGLILIDSEGRVVLWSPAAEKIFGFAAAEIVGNPLHDFVTPAKFRDKAQNRMEIFARTGEGRSIGRVVEFPARRKNGVEFPVLVCATPMRVEDRWWAAAAVRDITDRKRAEEQLMELQTIDALTGLPNRTRFLAVLAREIARSRRYERPLSLLILDVDGFGRINHNHGRKVGDHVLRTLAQLVENSIRTVDMAARLGDGEIGLLLSDTDIEPAEQAAERFRKRAADTLVPAGDGNSARFTISVGVAAMDGLIRDVETFMNRAEAALSRAKARGRDRVVRAEKAPGPICPDPECEPGNAASAEPARKAFPRVSGPSSPPEKTGSP
jgi:two-component system, cell cycle response regulator